MANSEQTKRALADGLRLALKKREYGDITVADITDCSGMSRNTFYYHFRDKEELVDWVFQTDLKPVIRAAEKSANWTELLGMVLDVAEKNREFYAEVLTSQGYASFSTCLIDAGRHVDARILAETRGTSQTDRELQLTARFYAHAVIGVVIDWVRGDVEFEPEELIALIEARITGAESRRP